MLRRQSPRSKERITEFQNEFERKSRSTPHLRVGGLNPKPAINLAFFIFLSIIKYLIFLEEKVCEIRQRKLGLSLITHR
jgi:hypothetical protein